MTQTHPITTPAEKTTEGRSRWPLFGAAAGLLGFVATMPLDGRDGVAAENVKLTHDLFVDLNPAIYRASMIVGYISVALLLVMAANWRRRVEHRLPGSTAAHLVPLGLVASAAGLTYGFAWKGALGNYIPGGMEDKYFDDQGLAVYFMLNDFGSFIGWLGVVVAAGAIAYMGLRERTVSRWIGAISLLPVIQTTVMVAGLGVPGVQGLLAGIWLFVACLGLTFGKSTITR
jgi:hypothetical protein